MNDLKTQKIEAFLKLVKHDVVRTKDVEAFILLVLKVIKDSKNEIGQISETTIKAIEEAVTEMKLNYNYFISKADEELKKTLATREEEVKTAFSDELKPIKALIDEVEIALEKLKNVKIPVVEKVIEKTEVIREIPIVTNNEIIKEVAVTDKPEVIRDKLESLQGDERLDASAIKGLENTKVDKQGNIQVIGGQSGVRLFVEGIKKGLVKTLNIKAGANTTVAHSVVNGLDTIIITSTGGGSSTFYTETPTGVIDSSNVTYTVLHSITTVISFAINGEFIHPPEYSVAGSTITFVTALDVGLSGKAFTIVYA